MARLEGLEPPTFWFVAKYSNPTELQAHIFMEYNVPLKFIYVKRYFRIVENLVTMLLLFESSQGNCGSFKPIP